ncbi:MULTISPECIES: dihydroxyacetone kinase subunit DhaL [Winogradskyella]|uniref:dihydroxyacetone kinase subunit DhaL n=1 Tax=Winogradskyella TaxID=286104 RepID=UPI0015C6A824|nr:MULTISPECIES: dihydroxyacetone kinase subunit DhaL [Winogradskyella]QXP79432.1 dihydroxyacetone kinase subunit L [Winogradskyella sp. HaHa_3_26]
METIKLTQLITWLEKTAAYMQENKTYLTELDSAIGDADHGFNMERGFQKVIGKIEELKQSKDASVLLKNTGMTLISSIGGASGPLYGTFFLQASMVLKDKNELTLEDLKSSFENGLKGIKSRGRAATGEKTMIDVLEPVVTTLITSAEQNLTINDALTNMLAAAEKGMKSTIDMLATKGRASYLGERSVGHQDPGATSSYFIVKALKESIN